MGIIENSEAFKKMTPNDLEEYREACSAIGELRDYYEERIDELALGQKFYASFAFNTSESGLFFHVTAVFHIRKRRKKDEKYIYFKIEDLVEVGMDEYLDMMNEAKKHLNEEEN